MPSRIKPYQPGLQSRRRAGQQYLPALWRRRRTM